MNAVLLVMVEHLISLDGEWNAESAPCWCPRGIKNACRDELEDGWLVMTPGRMKIDERIVAGMTAMMPVASSSSASSTSEISPVEVEGDRYGIYGIRVPRRGVYFETMVMMEGGDDCDRAGIAVRYDDANWIWAGLECVGGQLCLVTGGNIAGRRDLAAHGSWSMKEPLAIRTYVLGTSCVIEFGKQALQSGYDISSIHAQFTTTNEIKFHFVRIFHLTGRTKTSGSHAGIYVKSKPASTTTPKFQYLKVCHANSYHH